MPSYIPLVVPPSDLREPEGTQPVETVEPPPPVLNLPLIPPIPIPPAEVLGPTVITAVTAVAATTVATPIAESSSDNYHTVKSPIIGTFYRKPSPDKDVFVNVGDTVGEGDVLCVIEAMKLFNEIESDISGKIVKILVEDASPVEFDQPLFLIEP